MRTKPGKWASVVAVLGVLVLAGCQGPKAQSSVVRNAYFWPFASSSPWNTPVGSGAAFAPLADPRNQNLLHPGVTTNINAAQWSFPVYRASYSDPVRSVNAPQGTAVYQIPASAAPALPQGGDMHMEVVDPSGRWVDETWYTTPNGSNWSSSHYQRVDLFGSGMDRGTRAAFVSGMGGLIRTWELQAGVIPHALAFAVSRDFLNTGWVWPANSQDSHAGSTYGGHLPMGSFVAIPPNVNVHALGLSPAGVAIAVALQNFGAYLVDATGPGGPVVFYAEPSAEPWVNSARGDMAEIRNLLRVVTNNSPGNVGGGGWPRVPFAPPVG